MYGDRLTEFAGSVPLNDLQQAMEIKRVVIASVDNDYGDVPAPSLSPSLSLAPTLIPTESEDDDDFLDLLEDIFEAILEFLRNLFS